MHPCIAKATSACKINVLLSSTYKNDMSSLAVTMKLNNLINAFQSCSMDLLLLADKKITPNSTSGLPLFNKNIMFIDKE